MAIPKIHWPNFGKKIAKQLLVVVIGSLILVSALAWNSAIQEFLERNVNRQRVGSWLYAVIVSLIAFVAAALARLFVPDAWNGDDTISPGTRSNAKMLETRFQDAGGLIVRD